MSRIDFYFGSPPCEAFARRGKSRFLATWTDMQRQMRAAFPPGSEFDHRAHYIAADFGVAGGDHSAFAVARRVADTIIIDDIHVTDDTPESRAKFQRWYQETIEMWNDKSDHEARRLSPENPYGVLAQFIWGGNYASRGPKLCTSLRTFKTAIEADQYAEEMARSHPRTVYFRINAMQSIVVQPPAPPPVPPSVLHVTALAPSKPKRKRKARKSKGRRRA